VTVTLSASTKRTGGTRYARRPFQHPSLFSVATVEALAQQALLAGGELVGSPFPMQLVLSARFCRFQNRRLTDLKRFHHSGETRFDLLHFRHVTAPRLVRAFALIRRDASIEVKFAGRLS